MVRLEKVVLQDLAVGETVLEGKVRAEAGGRVVEKAAARKEVTTAAAERGETLAEVIMAVGLVAVRVVPKAG